VSTCIPFLVYFKNVFYWFRMSDDGISVVQLIRKGPKCLLRQYGSGWYLPHFIESRSVASNVTEISNRSIPSEIEATDLAEPIRILKFTFGESVSIDQIDAVFLEGS